MIGFFARSLTRSRGALLGALAELSGRQRGSPPKSAMRPSFVPGLEDAARGPGTLGFEGLELIVMRSG
jgi:hypothetical protein